MTAPPLVEVDESVILDLKQKLLDPNTTLPEKYRILFSLRNVKGAAAHDALELALTDESALFRHDVAFCLGQRQDARAVEVLTNILHNTGEHPMVRHEAGEALGAIGTEECLAPLRAHLNDEVLEVAETCQLALQRIEWLRDHPGATNEESPYYSVDPTPALPTSIPTEELRDVLLDEKKRMFDRYSALFALRNKGGKDAVAALGAVFGARSALLKHEVAYVMGQMQDPKAVEFLTFVLKDGSEHAMVRHEAAEALGAIADSVTIGLLREFATDPEPIVAHSCEVALDVLDFEQSGQLEYADKGDGDKGSGAGEARRPICPCRG
ncbi:deoxyhypusine hydroxylase [Volvox carteri f. nagariensis]|uniref:Deoxyhypusine hydroxylase n=1 Tax=Volvox carteri f. nagariensis TaxID=3068 RepID=D8THC0_VOLCA|nr:deoxyhypusine hydroxylase [Volvox carteri f. nagariensis]EFJ53045.1 deoxyhypusine hydroxylase [Volvox carteri f. nagariensis]|eukprot:XP_002946050.1 deoxyhypusine hydroxylase [Volvox carteri f. nagariensis]